MAHKLPEEGSHFLSGGLYFARVVGVAIAWLGARWAESTLAWVVFLIITIDRPEQHAAGVLK